MPSVDVPKQQRAAVKEGSGESATAPVKQIDVETPGKGQILVKVNWTGLCASDKSLIHDEWADFGVAMQEATHGIAGHEGAGVVVAVGEGMESNWKVGDRAGIKWIAATCGLCEFCMSDGPDEVHCLKQTNSGFTAAGTFQEYVIADGRYTSHIPDGVLDEEAAPILCGGVTAVETGEQKIIDLIEGRKEKLWRNLGTGDIAILRLRFAVTAFARQSGKYCLILCLANKHRNLPVGVVTELEVPTTAYSAAKRSGVKPGQWIVLPGAGGGLGHFAVQYANAMGMRVIAIDGGDAKRDLCKKLGAEVFIDFTQTSDTAAEVMKITGHGAHGVIVTAATKEAYAAAPGYLRPNGTVVVVGLPKDPSVIAGAPPIMMALKRLNFVGSVVGTLKDVEECLDFTARGLVHPILTKGKLEDLDDFMHKMSKGQLPGRAVLQVAA